MTIKNLPSGITESPKYNVHIKGQSIGTYTYEVEWKNKDLKQTILKKIITYRVILDPCIPKQINEELAKG